VQFKKVHFYKKHFQKPQKKTFQDSAKHTILWLASCKVTTLPPCNLLDKR